MNRPNRLPETFHRSIRLLALLCVGMLSACDQRKPPSGEFIAEIALHNPRGGTETAYSTIRLNPDGTAHWKIQIGERDRFPLEFDTTWRVHEGRVFILDVNGTERAFTRERNDLIFRRDATKAAVRSREVYEKTGR